MGGAGSTAQSRSDSGEYELDGGEKMKLVVNGRKFDVLSATGTSEVTFVKRSNRMMMYSERIPDIVDFQRMIKVAKFGYSFPKASRSIAATKSRKTAQQFLVNHVHRMNKTWAADPSGFDSICLATYGKRLDRSRTLLSSLLPRHQSALFDALSLSPSLTHPSALLVSLISLPTTSTPVHSHKLPHPHPHNTTAYTRPWTSKR
jgi:hypothetical protein